MISTASGLISPVSSHSDHLVVLTHGIMGTGDDLGYLAELLEKKGCSVLRSVSNEKMKSLNGIKIGSEMLASEITKRIKEENGRYKRLSFVGNSLGED